MDIEPQAFIFDHYHRKVMATNGVAVAYEKDGKVGLRDGVVISVDKATASAEIGFIGGDRVNVKGVHMVKHISKE